MKICFWLLSEDWKIWKRWADGGLKSPPSCFSSQCGGSLGVIKLRKDERMLLSSSYQYWINSTG